LLIRLCAGYRYSVEGALIGTYELAVLVIAYLVIQWWAESVLAVFRRPVAVQP
jgi:hypothetical protein